MCRSGTNCYQTSITTNNYLDLFRYSYYPLLISGQSCCRFHTDAGRSRLAPLFGVLLRKRSRSLYPKALLVQSKVAKLTKQLEGDFPHTDKGQT